MRATEVAKMRKLAWLGGGLALCFLLWAFWYLEAGNIGESSIAGTYTIAVDGDSSVLVLKPDHTFRQEMVHQGRSDDAQGSWRLFGEAGIAFSGDFKRLPGQTINQNGTAYGQIRNTFGAVSITLAPNPGGPTFHRKWLH
jgi:hypothetical protein